ncbi:poly-gamma-glutamate hydrolase family protein [Streptomyces sp. NPDC006798]|uniref:poly-gamma-glutamate hydrolase family protein n=1 Tax=Streptomyces sp. NPDC006798 TaxID=3155462 RepID=UPI0033F24624
MTDTSRRSVLTAALATAAGTTGILAAGPGTAVAAPAAPGAAPAGAGAGYATLSGYTKYSQIYQDTARIEGTDYGRRFKRHERVDATFPGKVQLPGTSVIALHGGGIEPGTSEVALGVAGYHPKGLVPTGAATDPRYDYWMFEGLLGQGQNAALHVTSTGCDDYHALGLTEGSLNVVSVHGCTANQQGAPGYGLVLGGLNQQFKELVAEELATLNSGLPAPAIVVVDGSQAPELGGVSLNNPCNRTLLKQGVQLELTNTLRDSLFDDPSTRTSRANTVNARFWAFTGAIRAAIVRLEAAQAAAKTAP